MINDRTSGGGLSIRYRYKSIGTRYRVTVRSNKMDTDPRVKFRLVAKLCIAFYIVQIQFEFSAANEGTDNHNIIFTNHSASMCPWGAGSHFASRTYITHV